MTMTKKTIIYNLIGLLVISRIFWYDFRLLLDNLSTINLIFIAHAILLFPFIAYFFAKKIRYASSNTIIIIFLSAALISLVTGLAFHNDLKYLIGDTYKFTFVPFGMLIGMSVFKDNYHMEFFDNLFKFSMIFLILKYVFFVYNKGEVLALMYGNTYDLYPFFFLLAAFVTQKKINILSLLVFFVVFFVIFSGQKRTLVLILTLSPLLILFLTRFSKKSIKFNIGYVIILLITYLFLVQTEEGVFMRLIGTNLEHTIGAESKRMEEVKTVINALSENYPGISIAFGAGSGATYEYHTPHGKFGYTETHTVHFTPAAIYYRHGLLGVLLSLILVIYTVLVIMKSKEIIKKDRYAALCSMMLLSLLISAISMYGVIDDILFGILLSILTLKINQSYANRI
jgi:hypothetical protein